MTTGCFCHRYVWIERGKKIKNLVQYIVALVFRLLRGLNVYILWAPKRGGVEK